MRRLLLILPFVLPGTAFAQSQAANPVSPFLEGKRVGTSANPIFAAISSVVPSASASSGQAAAPVELFSYGRRVGTQNNPLYVNLGNTLSSYLTKDQASATYLPKTGGTVQTLAVTTSFSPPSIAFDDLPRPCTPPLIAYVPDGQKFWTAMTADHNAGSSYIYKDTNSTNASTYVGCLLVNGSPTWVPFLINSQAGKW
ncbi:hypothetical protein [Asaia prunellae]|uniref:hypothetical protein n=1 Tax=Asaia prunellae TaxID=610245 RepID=UPI0004720927|nr:hypothetical protein [Asaia prunellae]